MSNLITIESARGVLTSNAKRFQAALGEDAPGRVHPVAWGPWSAAVLADCERQPELLKACAQAPDSVIDCLMVAANCGLVPGSAHGSFYLIPRWSGKRQRVECTYIIGYKGLTEMAYRHPRVHKCEGFVVYDQEPFEWEPGAGRIKHVWRPVLNVPNADDRIVAAYSRVILTVPGGTTVDQEPLVWCMSREQLLEARDRSDGWKAFKAGKIKSTPWATDFAAMCRKTAMRRHLSGGSIPRSKDLIMAIDSERREEERLEGESAVTVSPTASAASQVRQAVGLAPVKDVPVFELVEEAVAWIEQSTDADAIRRALAAAPFTGDDRQRLAYAVDDRVRFLESDQ